MSAPGGSGSEAYRSPTYDDHNKKSASYDLDDRLGIEFSSGNLYLAAFDKKTSKAILLPDEHGDKATPVAVAFVGDEILIGKAARDQCCDNSENTFMELDTLLGCSFDNARVQIYASRWKHKVVQRNNHRSLYVPSRNKYMSAEELVAQLLVKSASIAAASSNHTFRFATFALSSDDLSRQRRVQGHAETARIAGFEDVQFLPRAAGLVNDLFNDHAWYLQPKSEPLPFIVFEAAVFYLQISLVLVDGKLTTVVGTWEDLLYKRAACRFNTAVEAMLQHIDSCGDGRAVGLLISDVEPPMIRESIAEPIRNALQKQSSQLEVRNIEQPRTACRGIVYGGSDHRRRQVIVAKTSYSIELAVVPGNASSADSIRLLSPDAGLPCTTSNFLTLASSEQKGIMLCFSVFDNLVNHAHPYLLTEVALYVPASRTKEIFVMKASITSGHGMQFALLADDIQSLVSINYSNDGLVSVELESRIVAITLAICKKWLPKVVCPGAAHPPAVRDGDGDGDGEASTPRKTNKRLRKN